MTIEYPLPPPIGLKIKLARARKQLRQFGRSFEGFRTTHPMKWLRDADDVGEYYVYRIESPPAEHILEVLVDEAIHHLRGVLDHLATGFVENHTKKLSFNTQFPIEKDEPLTPKAIAAWDKRMEPFGPWRPFIEDLQPYKRGDAAETHPLWRLSRLDNLFKHSSLHLFVYRISYPNVSGLIQELGRPHDSGDVFARVPITVDVEKDFEPFIATHIAFGSHRMRVEGIGLESLYDIYNFVRDKVLRKAILTTDRWPRRLP
jgi:hypothetical protein